MDLIWYCGLLVFSLNGLIFMGQYNLRKQEAYRKRDNLLKFKRKYK